MNGQAQSQQQMIMLAAIGDLEVTRRQLILEIQARDARIAELEERYEEMRHDAQAVS